MDGLMEFMLRYYNLLTFFFLFIYAVLSKYTFWKPHNLGEHIVINSYIFGFTTYISILLFFISIVVHPSIYMYSMFFYIIFYMYTFGRFYKLSVGKNLVKLFKFLLGLLILVIATMIASIVIGIVLGYFGIIDFNS